ncbi:MAG: hypothetical protein CM15mP89_3950 [Gammaproteobacteria bacterium]|nr:MAG: hypothetical protein CM15mP89_3950 [Gammaproteobacteria bacterium]
MQDGHGKRWAGAHKERSAIDHDEQATKHRVAARHPCSMVQPEW